MLSLRVDQGPPCPICTTNEYKVLALVPSEGKAEPWRIVKCKHCHLVRTLPLPGQADLERLYDAAYFDGWLRDVASSTREKERFRRLFAFIHRHVARGRLLSVGCGLGFDVLVANELGFEAEGLEPSPTAVDYARKILEVPVLQGTLESFDCEGGSYDIVTFWDVLEHVPHPQSLLRRAASLLRPRGVIVVRSPNVRGLFPLVSFALMPLVGEWRHPAPPAHLYDFSPKSIQLLAEGCGLQVRTILNDEWPLDKLIAVSRRPNVTKLLATVLYPAARRLRRGNSMIVILEKPPEHPSLVRRGHGVPTESRRLVTHESLDRPVTEPKPPLPVPTGPIESGLVPPRMCPQAKWLQPWDRGRTIG